MEGLRSKLKRLAARGWHASDLSTTQRRGMTMNPEASSGRLTIVSARASFSAANEASLPA